MLKGNNNTKIIQVSISNITQTQSRYIHSPPKGDKAGKHKLHLTYEDRKVFKKEQKVGHSRPAYP